MSCFQIKSKKYDLENTSHAKMCVSRIFYDNETQDDVQTISNKVKISDLLEVSDADYRQLYQQIVLEFKNGTSIEFFGEDQIGRVFSDVKSIKFGTLLNNFNLHIQYKLDDILNTCYSGYEYVFPDDNQEHILEITTIFYDF